MASGEAVRLERDLAHARTAALANGMGVKSRLQTLQFKLRTTISIDFKRLLVDILTAIVNRWKKSPDSRRRRFAPSLRIVMRLRCLRRKYLDTWGNCVTSQRQISSLVLNYYILILWNSRCILFVCIKTYVYIRQCGHNISPLYRESADLIMLDIPGKTKRRLQDFCSKTRERGRSLPVKIANVDLSFPNYTTGKLAPT